MINALSGGGGPEPAPSCPLCRQPAAHLYHRDKFREYNRCVECALVFVPSQYHLSSDAEKAYYDLHENDLHDEGYERFLSRCAKPLLERLPNTASGLDFGCGPAPLLAHLLGRAGHRMATYDLYYQPDSSVLHQSFDFIVSTEVVEHLADPRQVLLDLWLSIRPGGLLALMTKLVVDRERFASWHYIRDPTHIVFFSKETFSWLAQYLNAELEICGSDVIFLKKP
ncbi:class I SAM-dependent methyltransferase [Microbulbifer pacificus]|uniref:class I SAM-dependent methyltransferase n=1 Tax=Microbulbifer pacificus TaxID=407164 RepID=UPI0018F882B8|nr:class I SAM-dependent methyltransferase [Microbulbifer pacificus]